MDEQIQPAFEIHQTPGAEVRTGTEMGTWHLQIPAGPQGSYRLAQLDDYTASARQTFAHRPPLRLQLRARVSAPDISGTWGFGLWNDPFSLSLGFGGGTRRFPALPNAVWFFFASPQNYLSFRDDKPAQGFLAQSFRSASIPSPLLALAAPAFPLMLWPRITRALRPSFRRWIQEDSFTIRETCDDFESSQIFDPTHWHSYTLEWHKEQVSFQVDGRTFETGISPKGPLGLVIWIDNQYAAFPPNGKLAYGTLANHQPVWLDVKALELTADSGRQATERDVGTKDAVRGS